MAHGAQRDERVDTYLAEKTNEITRLILASGRASSSTTPTASSSPRASAEAKRDATRAKRIAQAVEWMAEGKSRNWKYQ